MVDLFSQGGNLTQKPRHVYSCFVKALCCYQISHVVVPFGRARSRGELDEFEIPISEIFFQNPFDEVVGDDVLTKPFRHLLKIKL